MSIIKRPLRGLLLPAALVLAAGPAIAQAQDEVVVNSSPTRGAVTRSVEVAYGDLNLADARDYGRLHRRVSNAADRVCADDGIWTKTSDGEYHRCYKAAVNTAMAHIPASAAASN